jgi:hypothetical protein
MMDAVERSPRVGIGIEPTHVSRRLVATIAIALAGVVLAVALLATTIAGGRPAAGITDGSYDQIEALRGAHGLLAAPAPWADDSYDRIESQRGGVPSGGDRSYDQIEQLRGAGSAD